MDGDLKFTYRCYNCGSEVKMGPKDIVDFVLDMDYSEYDNLLTFFQKDGKKYNFCPKCAREEGYNIEDFEGWED